MVRTLDMPETTSSLGKCYDTVPFYSHIDDLIEIDLEVLITIGGFHGKDVGGECFHLTNNDIFIFE